MTNASAPTSAPARAALPWVAYLCLAAAMAIVGGYVGFSKALVIVFPVFVLAWLRFAIGALAMAGWVRRRPGEAPLDRRGKQLLFFESLFGNFLFSICMLYGIAHSTALAAGIIMAAIPAAVAVLSWCLLGERIGARVIAGVACAICGIALVSLARDSEGDLASGSLLGQALLFGAMLCEALYVVIGKRLAAAVGPRRISALINLWGLALVTPFAIWQWPDFSPGFVHVSSWSLLVVYSLAASVVTVWLWMTGLKQVAAASAGVFTIFLPLSAALVGFAIYGEQISAIQGAAFALALLGVVLASWPGSSSPGTPAGQSAAIG